MERNALGTQRSKPSIFKARSSASPWPELLRALQSPGIFFTVFGPTNSKVNKTPACKIICCWATWFLDKQCITAQKVDVDLHIACPMCFCKSTSAFRDDMSCLAKTLDVNPWKGGGEVCNVAVTTIICDIRALIMQGGWQYLYLLRSERQPSAKSSFPSHTKTHVHAQSSQHRDWCSPRFVRALYGKPNFRIVPVERQGREGLTCFCFRQPSVAALTGSALRRC